MKNKNAFTLIELSIVLVIIGLIVGAVLVGQDLIKAAQLRKLMSTLNQYETAMVTFKGKYGCLPGDCPKATQFFGARSGSCSGAADWETYDSPATCNGNGDRYVSEYGSGPGDPTQWHHETVTFWAHLSHAGLLDKIYSGVGKSGTFWGNAGGGYNAPVDWREATTTIFSFGTTGTNEFHIGVIPSSNTTGAIVNGIDYAAFSVEEMRFIDAKIDDDRPLLGRIRNGIWYGFTTDRCTSDNWSTTANYRTAASGPVCSLRWQIRY